MAITPLPPAPEPTDSTAQFNSKAFAWVGSLDQFTTETNALAVAADADATTAVNAKNDAESARDGAIAAANVTKWVSGTTYAEGAVVWSPVSFVNYRRKIAGGGTTDPSVDLTNWVQVTGTGNGNITFASGTAMLFQQSTAPVGWTKNTTNYNNHALRVVTGTASSGGSIDFSTIFSSIVPSGSIVSSFSSGTTDSVSASGTVGATTLATNQIPGHSHTVAGATNAGSSLGSNGALNLSSSMNTGNTGGGLSHDHSFTGSSHSHTVTGSVSSSFTGDSIGFNIKYVDLIIATKD